MNQEAASKAHSTALAVRKARSQVVLGEGSILGPKARLEFVLDPDENSVIRFAKIHEQMANEGSRQILSDAHDAAANRTKKFPNSTDAWVQAGFAALAVGSEDDAEMSFRRALELSPGQRNATLGLSRALHRKGKSAEALSFLENLLVAHPGDPEIIIAQAVILVDLDRSPEAKKILEQATDALPNNAALLAARGSLRLISFEFAGAVADLRKAINRRPEWLTARNMLGIAEFKRGHLDAAEQRFKEAERLGPLHQESFENLLRVYLAQQRFAEIRRLVASKTSAAEASPIIARIAGRAALQTEAWSEARMWLRVAADRTSDPNIRAGLLNDVGVTHSRQGNANRALELFDEAFREAPVCLYALNKARTLIDLGQPHSAVVLIRSLHGLNPHEVVDSEKVLVLALLRAEMHRDAARVARTLLSRPEVDADAYILLSGIYSEDLENPEYAAVLAKEGLLRWPETTGLKNNLAYALLLLGRPAEAEEIIRTIPQEDFDRPTSVALVATLGLLKLWQNDLAEGERLYNLAHTRASTSRYKDRVIAKRDLELARAMLRLNPADSRVRKLLLKVASAGEGTQPYAKQARSELLRLPSPKSD